MKIHHLEYTDGGILDPDDVLADVVEDKDKSTPAGKSVISISGFQEQSQKLGRLLKITQVDPDDSIQVKFNPTWAL
ncbi:Partitioning defective 3-like protein B [Camelus dromedarius]|uniref:Partitioning defective 3-like protein B n=1 Tax=Camelus dromedarius TaxID=9838 RepID=A0A5N4E551_CAMDR|nr:Partitioning defective 3-like protein B [Camelus dromedarius]